MISDGLIYSKRNFMQHTTFFTRSLLAAAILSVYTHGFAADGDTQSAELETVNVVGSMNKLQTVPFLQAKDAVNITAATLSEEGVEKADEIGRY